MTRLSHFSDCVQCNQVCSLPALSNVTVTTARTQFLELGPAKYHRMFAWDLLPPKSCQSLPSTIEKGRHTIEDTTYYVRSCHCHSAFAVRSCRCTKNYF